MTAPKILPDVEYLRECFRYEPKTGLVWWKTRPSKHFLSKRIWLGWNARLAETQAFMTPNGDGYLYSRLDGVQMYAHRVIWKLVTGREPPNRIDHDDGKTNNNRWKNLRAASHPQNIANRHSPVLAKSGVRGVHKARGKWIVQAGGRYVGSFEDLAEAVTARTIAMKTRYGEFAP